jgi:hypothetical protein
MSYQMWLLIETDGESSEYFGVFQRRWQDENAIWVILKHTTCFAARNVSKTL